MVKGNPKGFLGRLFQQFRSVEGSRVFHRFKTIPGRLRAILLRFIPARFLWLMPFLQDELKQRAPSLDELKDRMAGKTKPGEGLEAEAEGGVVTEVVVPPGVKSLYPEYRCVRGNPLYCEWVQQTLLEQPGANYCTQCGFPTLLPPETKIRGRRGTYQIEGFLKNRGRGRLYQALQLPTRQPVVIREYLLPDRYFNFQETQLRKEAFVNLAGVTLADGRMQDFRLVSPWDAIADPRFERCYLVSQGILDTYPSLASYVAETGAMTSYQVRQILEQVLQSLEFLHGQKFRLPSGLVQEGLTDGNISLDSLLIVPSFQGFFIYLCDLLLWEGRFDPPLLERPLISAKKDLQDLGYVAFYLLNGGTHDPVTLQPFNPRITKHWPLIKPVFKDYILSLIGIGTSSFETAEIARRALLQLPPEPQIIPPFSQPEAEAEAKKKKRRWWRPRLFGLLLLLLLLGLLIWWLFGRNQPQTAMDTDPFPCCIEQVSGIPTGTFTYTAEEYGAWDYILEQPNLIAKDTTLAGELYQRQPKLELNYQPVPSWTDAIAQVREEEAEFAIATPLNPLGFTLDTEEVAHDGLVVFVAFSYAQRENSLPAALKGQISFEQLRLLYTGEITNWQELGGPDLPVQLYVPPSDQAIELFKQRVLRVDANTSNIAEFEALLQQSNQPSRSFANLGRPPIIRTQTFETLRQVIQDFEGRDIGAIGFDSLSKVLGQCSVYPLAIVDGENDPISPLVQDNRQPITPNTDLCNAKGSYGANVEAFISQTYPLAYPLAVIYPRDNSRPPIGTKFAEILRTEQAQCLLSKTGLVPLRPYLDSTFCTQELDSAEPDNG